MSDSEGGTNKHKNTKQQITTQQYKHLKTQKEKSSTNKTIGDVYGCCGI